MEQCTFDNIFEQLDECFGQRSNLVDKIVNTFHQIEQQYLEFINILKTRNFDILLKNNTIFERVFRLNKKGKYTAIVVKFTHTNVLLHGISCKLYCSLMEFDKGAKSNFIIDKAKISNLKTNELLLLNEKLLELHKNLPTLLKKEILNLY
jgi:hypothetical protein